MGQAQKSAGLQIPVHLKHLQMRETKNWVPCMKLPSSKTLPIHHFMNNLPSHSMLDVIPCTTSAVETALLNNIKNKWNRASLSVTYKRTLHVHWYGRNG
jgi:hypothetical protein